MTDKTKNKTVLVLEDEEPLLGAIEDKLESEGFNVVTARTVDEALQHLEKGTEVDIIWLDHYVLGKKNGLDFIKELNEKNLIKDIPAFVVSNSVSEDTISQYLELGVQKYYAKVDSRLEDIIADIKENFN